MPIVIQIPTHEDIGKDIKDKVEKAIEGFLSPIVNVRNNIQKLKNDSIEKVGNIVPSMQGVKEKLLSPFSGGLKEEMAAIREELQETKTYTKTIADKIDDVIRNTVGVSREIEETREQEWVFERKREKEAREEKFERLKEKPVTEKMEKVKEGDIFSSLFGGTFSGTLLGGLSRKFMGAFSSFASRAIPSFIGRALSLGLKGATRLLPALVYGAFQSSSLSEKLGKGNFETFIASMLGGAEEGLMNAFKNAGVWGLQGAALGAFAGPVGILVGGLVGTALGGLMGYFGGERIYKWYQDLKGIVASLWERMANAVSGFFGGISDYLFGTQFNLSEKTRNVLAGAKERIASFQRELDAIDNEIYSLQKVYQKAVMEGNALEASFFKRKIDVLREKRASIEREMEKEERKINDISATLWGDVKGIYYDVRDWLSSSFRSMKQYMTDSLRKFKDRFEHLRKETFFGDVIETMKRIIMMPYNLMKALVDKVVDIIPDSLKGIIGIKNTHFIEEKEDVFKQLENITVSEIRSNVMKEVMVERGRMEILGVRDFNSSLLPKKDVEEKASEIVLLKEMEKASGVQNGNTVLNNQSVLNATMHNNTQIIASKTTPYNTEANISILDMKLRGLR